MASYVVPSHENLIQCLYYVCALTGVSLSLRGIEYPNNSIISITEIGETDPTTNLNDGLQCITDRTPCCRFQYRVGEWFFPNGTKVPLRGGSGATSATTFYRNRGYDDGTVNLNHVSPDVLSPTGRFCCVVPDANDISQTVCVIISKIFVNILSSQQLTFGYSHCSRCCHSSDHTRTCRTKPLPQLFCSCS